MPENTQKTIYVAGHRGMVGAAIVRRLQNAGHTNIITRTRDELDLLDQAAVNAFFQQTPIDEVYLAAAKVGGILANNNYPAQFIFENLTIEANIIHAAYMAGVQKLLFLGSSCIYPKHAAQPMTEDSLLTGPLEPTNEPYAIAKIAGIKLCESYNRQYGCDYRSVMPTNLYGPGDNFHPENSHVIPALMRRFHEAMENCDDTVTVWGTGKPMREFLHVNEMADACVFVMNLSRKDCQKETEPMHSHINVGAGTDISIANLSQTIACVVGFNGHIFFDPAMPDGPPRKLLDVSRLNRMGWKAGMPLKEGLKQTYAWFLDHLVKDSV